MSEKIEVLKVEIAKLELGQNDILVIKFPEVIMEPGELLAMRNSISEYFPKLKFFLVDKKVEMAVIRQTDEQ